MEPDRLAERSLVTFFYFRDMRNIYMSANLRGAEEEGGRVPTTSSCKAALVTHQKKKKGGIYRKEGGGLERKRQKLSTAVLTWRFKIQGLCMILLRLLESKYLD